MKRSDGVRAKSSRHSSHLLNRLLGWRRRGSFSSHEDPPSLQQSSSVAQEQPTPTQRPLQDAPRTDSPLTPATNILFSIAHKGQDDRQSEAICLEASRLGETLAPDPPTELCQSSANGEILSPVQCPYVSNICVVTTISASKTSSDNPKYLSDTAIHFPSGSNSNTVLDISDREAAHAANSLNFDVTIACKQELSVVQNCYDQVSSDNNEIYGHMLPDNHNLMQVLETHNFCEEPALSEQEMSSSFPSGTGSSAQNNLAANFDQRYGGQYLTPEQLPEFCEQLHQLVEMIRNIQAYSTVTGEYPSALERRLACEAREVAALAAEVRNARDSVARARAQRRAVRALRRDASRHMTALREEEMRELETTVRAADRMLFKSWECLREEADVNAFDSLLLEVKMWDKWDQSQLARRQLRSWLSGESLLQDKQNALSCLSRLIENRCAALELLSSSANHVSHLSLAPLLSSSGVGADQSFRTRYYSSRRPFKRKKRERDVPSHSVPVSSDPSEHSTQQSPSGNRLPSICTAIQRGVNMNPMTVPYELISQSGIPANMLPSMGSNSNHNLTFTAPALPGFVPFRFSARQFVPATDISVTSSDRDTVGDVLLTRISDRSSNV